MWTCITTLLQINICENLDTNYVAKIEPIMVVTVEICSDKKCLNKVLKVYKIYWLQVQVKRRRFINDFKLGVKNLISTYINTKMCVCVSVYSRFLGHFVTDWETLRYKVCFCFRKCSKTIKKILKSYFSQSYYNFSIFL